MASRRKEPLKRRDSDATYFLSPSILALLLVLIFFLSVQVDEDGEFEKHLRIFVLSVVLWWASAWSSACVSYHGRHWRWLCTSLASKGSWERLAFGLAAGGPSVPCAKSICGMRYVNPEMPLLLFGCGGRWR